MIPACMWWIRPGIGANNVCFGFVVVAPSNLSATNFADKCSLDADSGRHSSDPSEQAFVVTIRTTMNSFAVQMNALRACSPAQSRSTAARRVVKAAAFASFDAEVAKKTVVAASLSLALSVAAFVPQASAELNQYEAEIGGEFGNGTAQQYGEAEIPGKDFSKQDLRRSNFTAADCRDCNFKDAKLAGAYFIKSVVARANFENADLSDTLMDRAVIVDANLRNAVLQRAVFTRSDFSRSDIYGADFTNALVDKTQQMQMCKIADGVNTVTGVSTRKSLNCSSRRQFAASTPSNPEGPQVSDEEKAAFTASMPNYRE